MKAEVFDEFFIFLSIIALIFNSELESEIDVN